MYGEHNVRLPEARQESERQGPVFPRVNRTGRLNTNQAGNTDFEQDDLGEGIAHFLLITTRLI
jgi:hypothetical protein